MSLRSIDHIQLAMPPGKEEEARHFYAEVLGLDEIAKPHELAKRGGAWFRSGNVAIHLGVDPDFHPAKKAHPAFICADYATLLKRLKGHAIEVVSDGRTVAGKAHCYVADPFGNRLELLED